MGGASIALPQDLQSALNGNPATLTQFHGTQFSFSGSWVEGTIRVAHTPPAVGGLPGLGEFSAKSNAQGAALGNIGFVQDFSSTDMPRMHISTYSLAETFDVGVDYGTQVDPGYEGSPFPFKGELDRVVITLTD